MKNILLKFLSKEFSYITTEIKEQSFNLERSTKVFFIRCFDSNSSGVEVNNF